jgi:hypothetical protein
MEMFNKKFKLIATMVGLVGVLAMMLAVPGATQQPQPVPTRNQIVQGLSQMAATLTASEGDILDVENTMFSSAPSLKKPNPPDITFAYIPLHPSSRSIQLLRNWLYMNEPFGDYLNLGALYVEDDFPCGLAAGIYQLKLREDLKIVALDLEGNELVIGYAYRKESLPSTTLETASPITGWLSIILILCAETDVQICFERTDCQYDRETGKATQCSIIKVCVSC